VITKLQLIIIIIIIIKLKLNKDYKIANFLILFIRYYVGMLTIGEIGKKCIDTVNFGPCLLSDGSDALVLKLVGLTDMESRRILYRDAAKSVARPGRKQATAT
jgi:hypothetical protein